MYNKFNRIHFIGIGGIGMSGIAELVSRNGYRITGSDLALNDSIRHLQSLGISVYIGHAAENVLGADLVVYSSAVKEGNSEFDAARAQEIPLIPRAEMLAELMRLKYGIAVAGAHGKTTTTSMISVALMEGGLDPTIVVGGRMDNFGGTNARMGAGDFMVVEADESDGSFNKLSPSIAIVTNIDREHMGHYKNMPALKQAFVSFLNKVPFYGLCVLCGDNSYVKTITSQIHRRKRTYGFQEGNQYQIIDYQAKPSGTRSLVRAFEETFEVNLKVPGKHNVLNALATIVVADELGIARAKTLTSLAAFQGVQRRFQKKGELRGVHLIDDYAHHPSEIRVTMAAARERYPDSKIRVVFQPHRFSRVEDLFDQFSTCFNLCDEVVITDIYSAGEQPIEGIHSKHLSESISESGQNSTYIAKPLEAVKSILEISVPGDVLITLGAGDLPSVYREIL